MGLAAVSTTIVQALLFVASSPLVCGFARDKPRPRAFKEAQQRQATEKEEARGGEQALNLPPPPLALLLLKEVTGDPIFQNINVLQLHLFVVLIDFQLCRLISARPRGAGTMNSSFSQKK